MTDWDEVIRRKDNFNVEAMEGITCCFNLQLPRGYEIILQHFYININNYMRCKTVENEGHQSCLFMGCATHISATFFLSLTFSPSVNIKET